MEENEPSIVAGAGTAVGRDETLAIAGGLHNPLRTPRDTEETPLLPDGRTLPSKDGDDGEGQWAGQSELDALPWTKRPSVSPRSLPRHCYTC